MSENNVRNSSGTPLEINFCPVVKRPELPQGFIEKKDDCLVFRDEITELPDNFSIMSNAKEAVTHSVVVRGFSEMEDWLEKYCINGIDNGRPKGVSVIFTSREERTKFRNAIPHIESKMWLEVWNRIYIVKNMAYYLYHIRLGNTKIACEIARDNPHPKK